MEQTIVKDEINIEDDFGWNIDVKQELSDEVPVVTTQKVVEKFNNAHPIKQEMHDDFNTVHISEEYMVAVKTERDSFDNKDTYNINKLNFIKVKCGRQTKSKDFIAREECVSSNSAFLKSTLDEKENVKVEPQVTRQSTVLTPVRARKRKLNVQRQGLSYREQYDKSQIELKRKAQVLEERRIALEEKKWLLAEKKFELENFASRKNLEILENRLVHDVEQRNELRKIIDRREKIIEMLLLQMKK